MSGILGKTLRLLTGAPEPADAALFRVPKNRKLKNKTERELLRLESKIGAELFGPLEKDHTRQFFCLDESTWIWHETWSKDGKDYESTVRYEVQKNGILKVMDGARYEYIEGEELDRLVDATRIYYERVAREIYQRDPVTGHKFA